MARTAALTPTVSEWIVTGGLPRAKGWSSLVTGVVQVLQLHTHQAQLLFAPP
jgi:hypothetical protein